MQDERNGEEWRICPHRAISSTRLRQKFAPVERRTSGLHREWCNDFFRAAKARRRAVFSCYHQTRFAGLSGTFSYSLQFFRVC